MAGLEEREGFGKKKKKKTVDCCIFCRHAITFRLCLCMLVYVVCEKNSRVLQRLTCSGSARCQRMHLPLQLLDSIVGARTILGKSFAPTHRTLFF